MTLFRVFQCYFFQRSYPPFLCGEFLEAQSKLKDMGTFDHKSYWSAMVAPRFAMLFFVGSGTVTSPFSLLRFVVSGSC